MSVPMWSHVTPYDSRWFVGEGETWRTVDVCLVAIDTAGRMFLIGRGPGPGDDMHVLPMPDPPLLDEDDGEDGSVVKP